MTKRTKVAPHLAEVMRLWPVGGDHGDHLRREFRALLAVARAAQRVSADTIGDPYAIMHLCALDRALARLDRLPGSGEKKGRAR